MRSCRRSARSTAPRRNRVVIERLRRQQDVQIGVREPLAPRRGSRRSDPRVITIRLLPSPCDPTTPRVLERRPEVHAALATGGEEREQACRTSLDSDGGGIAPRRDTHQIDTLRPRAVGGGGQAAVTDRDPRPGCRAASPPRASSSRQIEGAGPALRRTVLHVHAQVVQRPQDLGMGSQQPDHERCEEQDHHALDRDEDRPSQPTPVGAHGRSHRHAVAVDLPLQIRSDSRRRCRRCAGPAPTSRSVENPDSRV